MTNGNGNERRDAMMAKLKKLFAMARHAGSNETEAETALRQANKIMTEFGIQEAEVDMAAINAHTMKFGEREVGPDGRKMEPGKVHRQAPRYAGYLALGVARFCGCVVEWRVTANGSVLVFQGEQQDTLFAQWLFGILVNRMLAEQLLSGWTRRGEAVQFLEGAALTLSRRLKELAAERRAAFQQAASHSKALAVVDHKAMEVARLFGHQRTRTSYSGSRSADSGARVAGREAGATINIPSGRPIGSTARKQLN